MTQKIGVASPELPYSAHVESRIDAHASLFWFAEIEALFAYLFNEHLDEIIIDEKLMSDTRFCAQKYQKIMAQMYPSLAIKSAKVSSKNLIRPEASLTYFPVLEDLFKNGELQSVFQPIVRPHNNNKIIIGFECLTRIRFNNKIFTPEFIFNYAQEKLLLVNYDKICLMQALRLAPKLSNLLIFLNIRPQTLMSPNFFSWFKDLLKKNNLKPEHIILEVTEQHCVISESAMALQCEELKQLGLRIAVDDFGCGISNHSMIDIMKPDFIKISGRFVKNSHDNIIKKKLIKNILDLSADCKINAVIESIESVEDWSLARDLGAELAQGFYFFKPMPHESLTAYINSLRDF